MKKIGIDIGGTQLRCAIFDENNNILEKVKYSNERSEGPKKNVDKLIEFINKSKEKYNFRGIGVGCPGPLNIRLGKILNPPNLSDWSNFEIVNYIEEKTNLKTLLNNDANVAGLSEAIYGAGKGYENVFYITISTGIGGASIINGEIVSGANSNAGELYNMIINEKVSCRENLLDGCVESQCSGTSLAKIASEVYGSDKNSKDLFDLYYKNDEKAVEIVDGFILNIAKMISNISSVLDPDVFVIGGSVAINNPDIITKIKEKAKELVICPQYLRVELVQFDDDAGLIGAAELV